MLKLSLQNISEIIYRHNNGRGFATQEENEFLISIEANFHNSNISDICIAVIKHYRKVICFTLFPYAYWNIYCSQWWTHIQFLYCLLSSSVHLSLLHLRRWLTSPDCPSKKCASHLHLLYLLSPPSHRSIKKVFT